MRSNKEGHALALWNPLGFVRTEPVRVSLAERSRSVIDEGGQRQPVQRMDDVHVFVAAGLPAFSRHVLEVSCELAGASAAVDVVEDGDFFRIETDCGISYLEKSSGVITSYYDKALERELVHYSGNRANSDVPALSSRGLNLFQLVDCAPTDESAWKISDAMHEQSLVRGAEVELVDNGPIFARFQVRHQFRSSCICEDVVFFKSLPRIEFEIAIDWREAGSPEVGVPHLKVAFGTRMSAARVRSEGPFCIAERPADGIEQPMQTWVDLVGEEFGFVVLNDSKYGHDALGSRLRISLLRNSYVPDPDSDRGEHRVRLAFVPHRDDLPVAELVKAGMSYNREPIAVRCGEPASSGEGYLRMGGGESVVCTMLRRAEHSDRILLRFYETEGQKVETNISLRDGIVSATEVNFLEHPLGEDLRVVGGVVTVRFRPYEIKTLLVSTLKESREAF